MHRSAGFVDRTLRSDAGWFRYTVDSDFWCTTRTCWEPVWWPRRAPRPRRRDGRARSRAARVSIDAQGADGSWPYGAEPASVVRQLPYRVQPGRASQRVARVRRSRVGESLATGVEFWVSLLRSRCGPRYFDGRRCALRRAQCRYSDRRCARSPLSASTLDSSHIAWRLGPMRICVALDGHLLPAFGWPSGPPSLHPMG